ncbi:MAG: hypothetical protein J1F23_08390 [Oscillospiraceae bacterium]|nr:hypothetical protein [Oscillospiraceae bacterium]
MGIVETYAQAVKSLWRGVCTVTVRINDTVNEKTGRPVAGEVDTCKDEPCRISFETVTTPEHTDNANRPVQRITLIIDPAVEIPPGSKITVTQNGVTGEYEQSGVPAVYTNHKEVPLELFKGWA